MFKTIYELTALTKITKYFVTLIFCKALLLPL